MSDPELGLEPGDLALDADLAQQLADVAREFRARQWTALQRLDALLYTAMTLPDGAPSMEQADRPPVAAGRPGRIVDTARQAVLWRGKWNACMASTDPL
jgi:hypothetical protein